MKKYTLLLFFLFTAVSLHAQILGEVTVTRKVLVERDGKLVMELNIRVGRRAVTRSQSWMVIPELSTTDRKSVKLFPHVQINGKYQKHMLERRRVLTGAYWVERQPYAVIDVNGKTDQMLTYKMEVPYESWMDAASLVIRQVQCSPGDEKRVFTVDINGAVETARK